MKRLLSILALAGVLMTPAVQAADWSGIYGGVTGSTVTGDADFFFDGVHAFGPYDSEGSAYGGFVGYNFQNGMYVYGGELSYMTGDITEVDEGWYSYDNILDVKARVGYAAESVLIYGTIGYSSVDFSESYAEPESDPLSGFGYGAGIDIMVTNNIFAGVEYFTRAVSGDLTYPDTSPWTVEGNLTTITARIGMNF